jgi:hypothetical protein
MMLQLDELIGSGFITLVILSILAAEALFYLFYLKRLRGMLATLAAGACLVMALRAALLDHSTAELALFLALGFIFHVLEVWQWLKMSKHQRL